MSDLRYGSVAYRHRARKAAENIAAGRAWIGEHYVLDVTDEEIAGLTRENVMDEIDHLYEGGWAAFTAERAT